MRAVPSSSVQLAAPGWRAGAAPNLCSHRPRAFIPRVAALAAAVRWPCGRGRLPAPGLFGTCWCLFVDRSCSPSSPLYHVWYCVGFARSLWGAPRPARAVCVRAVRAPRVIFPGPPPSSAPAGGGVYSSTSLCPFSRFFGSGGGRFFGPPSLRGPSLVDGGGLRRRRGWFGFSPVLGRCDAAAICNRHQSKATALSIRAICNRAQ